MNGDTTGSGGIGDAASGGGSDGHGKMVIVECR